MGKSEKDRENREVLNRLPIGTHPANSPLKETVIAASILMCCLVRTKMRLQAESWASNQPLVSLEIRLGRNQSNRELIFTFRIFRESEIDLVYLPKQSCW